MEGNCKQSSALRRVNPAMGAKLQSPNSAWGTPYVFLFIAISSHEVLDEQKSAFFLLLDAGNSFVLAMLLFVIHKVCFSLEFFGSFLFPVRVWRRKLFSSVSYAPLTVPLSYTAQGKEKQNPWHRAEMLHYMVCPG